MHRRLSSGRLVSQARVGPLTDEQRSALADLLGLDRLPPEYATVSVARLEQAITDAGGESLRETVARLLGPLDDRAGRRAAAAADRAALWAWLDEHPVVAGQPALFDWVTAVRRAGLIGGSAVRTRKALDDALRVIAELPAAGALLSALDVDLLLSDHEWCTYAELSGIGIHQLITGDDGNDAVTTARFVWDGHDLRSDTGRQEDS